MVIIIIIIIIMLMIIMIIIMLMIIIIIHLFAGVFSRHARSPCLANKVVKGHSVCPWDRDLEGFSSCVMKRI